LREVFDGFAEAKRAGLRGVRGCTWQRQGVHTLGHSYRSWLDAVVTTIAVQQKLTRHADIRTTMNVYGTVVADEIATASGKVARLVVNGTGDCAEPNSSD